MVALIVFVVYLGGGAPPLARVVLSRAPAVWAPRPFQARAASFTARGRTDSYCRAHAGLPSGEPQEPALLLAATGPWPQGGVLR